MSPVRDGLLAAIVDADRDDDLPWLAFADWLDEHSDSRSEILKAARSGRTLPMDVSTWITPWTTELAGLKHIAESITAEDSWLIVSVRAPRLLRWLKRHSLPSWPLELRLIDHRPDASLRELHSVRKYLRPGHRVGLRMTQGPSEWVHDHLFESPEMIELLTGLNGDPILHTL